MRQGDACSSTLKRVHARAAAADAAEPLLLLLGCGRGLRVLLLLLPPPSIPAMRRASPSKGQQLELAGIVQQPATRLPGLHARHRAPRDSRRSCVLHSPPPPRQLAALVLLCPAAGHRTAITRSPLHRRCCCCMLLAAACHLCRLLLHCCAPRLPCRMCAWRWGTRMRPHMQPSTTLFCQLPGCSAELGAPQSTAATEA